MEIKKNEIIEDFNRDLYWTKISFHIEDKATSILACVSWEYLLNYNRFHTVTKKQKNEWLDRVVVKYMEMGLDIFRKKIHYSVDAVTTEGEKNGYEFLKSKK